jgi:acetolactate synthase-1/2/3 large subunit
MEFAERCSVPVFCARLARGLLPVRHTLNLGLASIGINPVLRRALHEADVLITVGGRLEWDLEFGESNRYNPDLKVIQVNIDPMQISRPRRVDVGIVGDAALVLRQLVGDLKERSLNHRQRTTWAESLRKEYDQFKRQLAVQANVSDAPIHPAKLCQELQASLESDAIIAIGGGEIWGWGRQYLDTSPPGCILQTHHTGTLGAEIPHAIAAKLARPSAQVVALTGDGGFGYSAIELETALRCNVPITCIIANDSCWAMERWTQKLTYGEERIYATGLHPVDYAQLSAALNVHSERVEDPAQVGPAIRRGLTSGRPACIDVVTRDLPGPDTHWWLIESGEGTPG